MIIPFITQSGLSAQAADDRAKRRFDAATLYATVSEFSFIYAATAESAVAVYESRSWLSWGSADQVVQDCCERAVSESCY